ncbi:MAG: PD-(D/E)XK nuclease family protein, partial [Turicibacter sp.]|nr:PD-(D/E)XK nuclease family protein [Turicibacter sp.]
DYTYSDIAIYTGDATAYDELIAAIFPKFDIPIFLDYKESMLHHPLMTMIYHLFDVILTKWRHESLFTVIKTGLLMNVETIKKGQSFYELYQAYQRKVDVLENYCLARNLKKKDWQAKEPWSYERYQGLGRGYVKTDADIELEQVINQIRQEISTFITSFEKQLKKAKTYKDYAIATFSFLEECQVPQKLSLFEESAEELQDLQLYKKHNQVWNQLLNLFEQLVEIGQEEVVSLEDFISVFKSGIEEMVYATVPPRLDQVAIGELRRARYQLVSDLKTPHQYGIKHAFVLGVNEGQIPKIVSESSLLSEGERESLKAVGIELAPSLVQTQIDEQFILYTVFTSAKESLTLSYASSNDEGKEFLPSYIYMHLRSLFPNAKEDHVGREWEEDVYQHLTTHSQTVAHLIATLKHYPNRKPYYEPLLTYYQEMHPLIYQAIERILNYHNEVSSLDEQLTKELYSEEIVASVSRLELFNQCEFAHYLRYGLKLKEREQYKIDLPHIGELYHEALKRSAERIKKENRTFADLTANECLTLAKLVSEELSDQLLYKILRQNKRMMRLTERLTQVVYKTLLGLKYQGKNSAFKPLFFELPFDTHETSGIHLKSRELPHGFKLSLRGIIDRVDLAKNEKGNQAYLRIIDYKSSERDLELDKVYYGLSLQLLTYLDIVVSNALQLIDLPAEVGGLLYFHVHHPFISHDADDLLHQEAYEQKVEQLQHEKYKMKGYLPDDYDVVHLSDSRLGEQLKSDIVPITLKKDGSFSSRGNATLTGDTLHMLRKYTNRMIEQSAIKITQGQLNINPTKYGKSTACDYCEYRGICQFDADLGNEARVLPKMKSEVALETIKCKLEEGGAFNE